MVLMSIPASADAEDTGNGRCHGHDDFQDKAPLALGALSVVGSSCCHTQLVLWFINDNLGALCAQEDVSKCVVVTGFSSSGGGGEIDSSLYFDTPS